jgi:hypothetical protein
LGFESSKKEGRRFDGAVDRDAEIDSTRLSAARIMAVRILMKMFRLSAERGRDRTA